MEEALAQLGGLSRVQCAYVTALVLIRCNLGMQYFVYTFLRHPIPFRCKDPPSGPTAANFTLQSCSAECTDYEFDTEHGDSLSAEWELVCGE